jgi:galactose-1-phosphate uridylyltransferase
MALYRWPVRSPNGVSAFPVLMCNAGKDIGSCYCPRHRQLAIAPIQPRPVRAPLERNVVVVAPEQEELIEIAA